MFHSATYTHPGGATRNEDALRYTRKDTAFYAALCDGVGGSTGGALAAEYCAEHIITALEAGKTPEASIGEAQAGFCGRQANAVQLKNARSTACALKISGNACTWANIGDSRLYHFSGGALKHMSMDDSAAYKEYLAGNISYADLRMHTRRSILTACIGDGSEITAHADAFPLSAGDGILACTDGFWQYIYETEMEADLCKSASAQSWLDLMLLRITQRSHLGGDNLSALAILLDEGGTHEF